MTVTSTEPAVERDTLIGTVRDRPLAATVADLLPCTETPDPAGKVTVAPDLNPLPLTVRSALNVVDT